MQHFDADIAQLEDLSVGCLVNGKMGFGMGAVDDRRTRGLGQIQVTAYKIRMLMGLQDIADLCLTFLRKLEVNIDITQRVDDSGFSATLDIIGCFTQASGIQLFNEHTRDFPQS